MKLWEVLVPTQWNDGRPIHTRHHRVWDAKVMTISGGLTILTPTKGKWDAPDGSLFAERMIPVRVACSEGDIVKVADITAKHYQQLAVMYYLVSEVVVIKHYPENNRTLRAGTGG